MSQDKRFRGYWTSVVSDALDQAAFRKYLGASSKLQALEEKGLEALPTFGELMFDLDAAFLYPTPVLRPPGTVLPSHRFNGTVVKQLLELPEYQEIHLSTQADNLLSAVAVIEVGDTVLRLLKEEEKEQIRQMQEKENELNKLQQKADEAEGRAGQAQQEADQAAAEVERWWIQYGQYGIVVDPPVEYYGHP